MAGAETPRSYEDLLARAVEFPLDALLGIYSRETGQGMQFGDEMLAQDEAAPHGPASVHSDNDDDDPDGGPRLDLEADVVEGLDIEVAAPASASPGSITTWATICSPSVRTAAARGTSIWSPPK